jgi:hypothetical protein
VPLTTSECDLYIHFNHMWSHLSHRKSRPPSRVATGKERPAWSPAGLRLARLGADAGLHGAAILAARLADSGPR